jgi:uncharacterized protein (TIGR00299 family) protein
VAALVDAGVPRAAVTEAVGAIGVRGLKVGFGKRKRGAFVGTGFTVTWPGQKRERRPAQARRAAVPDGRTDHHHDHGDHHHDHDHDHDHDHHRHQAGDHHHHEHRDYAEIRRLLKRARLDADTRELAGEIFARVAQAESSLHGVPVDRIAFHEVGAYDSIADIVGAAAAISWLAPVEITSSPPVLGTGSIRTAHGWVPVPAPATAELLKGAPVRAEGQGELTTPTGAAILSAVVDRFGPMPPMQLAAQGLGAGNRQLTDRANVLRVVLGQPLGQALPASAPSVTLLETNLDDMSPQLIEPLLGALFAAGAVDVWSTPILMKKGRPGFTVSALVPDVAAQAVTRAFFENSTTIGLRSQSLGRTVLARSHAEVKTPFGNVAVKVSALEGRVLVATPEFEACRLLAQARRTSVRQVLAAATAAATYQFGLAGTKTSKKTGKKAGPRTGRG